MFTYNGRLKGGSYTTHLKISVHKNRGLASRKVFFIEYLLSGLLSRILTKCHTPLKNVLF